MTDKWVSLETVEEYTEIPVFSLRKACRRGDLRAVKVGREWRTRLSWVDEWLMKGAAA